MDAVYHTHSDDQLIQLLANNDQQAFAALFDRYFTRLFNYAYEKTGDHFLAQEVVQELFIKLWQQRERLSIQHSVKAYLFTTARHLIIDQYRREASRHRHVDAFSSRQVLATDQTEEQVRLNELQQTYAAFLEQLPDQCRRVFTLSRQGFSNREIGQQLGISEKTVEQHITKALHRLRGHLLTMLLLFTLHS